MKNEIFNIQVPLVGATAHVTLREGESLCILGENLCGKSSMLKRIYKHEQGVVYRNLDSIKYTKEEQELFYREVVYFNGSLYGDPKETVGSFIDRCAIKLGCVPMSLAGTLDLSKEEISLKLKDVDYMTAGKLGFVQALSKGAKVIIIDDVFGLDMTLKKKLIPFLKEYKKQNACSFIIGSTDAVFCASLCDWMLVMEGGLAVEYGLAKHIIKEPRHPYTKWFVNASLMKKEDFLVFIRTGADAKPKKNLCRFLEICPVKNGECKEKAPGFSAYNNTDWTACCLIKSDGEVQ